ncbi:Asp-tRNA(Asn)/Glu-tRNA(Gln) amidotransferase subunit GatC [Candidatus Woesearchaeota archaeon]|nr:Asp-tRNA(Asn)/Glu-tRNA(Gln) amidotransferase subunit GatC [Candidatus Woesearchaeota archaeon]
MKTEINEELIEHVSKVARLDLTEKEKQKFSEELKEIVAAFSKLDEVDTTKTEISLQPVELKNVLREDIPEKCLTQEEALSLTKHKKDGYFKGPKAI